MTPDYDIAIIGGGPAGSTLGTLLKRYNPALRVLILEKERFPREHVGESQLPPIGHVLAEMGVWDKVEAAGFPIKIGATYRWGATRDLWDFEFVPLRFFKEEPRPAKYQGPRRMTAFQVDRAVYDTILLDHAAACGVEVRQETPVARVHVDGAPAGAEKSPARPESRRVESLELASGEVITARHYVDASGHVGILRRALDIPIDCPTALKNIALWDYWTNAEWAVHIGVGATRVQVISIGCGWIWFIPLSPTRTSIGFICLAEYYKQRGDSAADLYAWAVQQDHHIASLIRNATRENNVRTTKDWSFVADKAAGPNWFLCGEALGFADPILAGGMTLAHTGARQLAYTILEIDRSPQDAAWLRSTYESYQRERIRHYIRFADFWYAGNGIMTDLQAHTARIAKDAGLSMDPREAFRWLSLGGFVAEDYFFPGVGGLDFLAAKEVAKIFTGTTEVPWELNKFTHFRLNLLNARRDQVPIYADGRVVRTDAWRRAGRVLPLAGAYKVIADALKTPLEAPVLASAIRAAGAARTPAGQPRTPASQVFATLETMILDGWVTGQTKPGKPTMNFNHLAGVESNIHPNQDTGPSAAPSSVPSSVPSKSLP